ncbi:MAG: hypothetical protein JW808_03270 [Victivallales bacterium]|nr:hypothetical protein [Victivallales bacterium]
MKTLIAIFMMALLITTSGCWWNTRESRLGGVASVNEEFSITVPSSVSIKQGQEATITITLNRGDSFKRDVRLDINADGISIMPNYVLVKASDRPDVEVKITAAANAAIGKYPVSVKGMPESGRSASTQFNVRVEAP